MDYETVDLFPTRIYQFYFDEKFIESCKSELDKHCGENEFYSPYYTDYLKQEFLKVGPNTELLHQQVENFVTKAFGERYLLTQSWMNYVPKYRVHSMHRHGDYNRASAILYFDEIGQTNFYDPRVQIYNDIEHVVTAQCGKLVIFPAWLMHEMPFHQEDKLRLTMAFNLKKKHSGTEYSPNLT